MRPPRSRCSGRRGERPRWRRGGDHRRLRHRAADRGHAAHRGARPGSCGSAPCWPGMLTQADHRPAHLTRIRQALTSLPEDDQRRLGVIADWKTRPAPAHLPADRAHLRPGHRRPGQGRTRRPALADPRRRICDDLLEASIPDEFKDASTALAVDWTDVETFSRPPPAGTSDCADPEASWGHRNPAAQPRQSCSSATTSPPAP